MEVSAKDIGLAFKNFSVSTNNRTLLHNVNGYVAKGGMTAGKLLLVYVAFV